MTIDDCRIPIVEVRFVGKILLSILDGSPAVFRLKFDLTQMKGRSNEAVE
jgi:hypothetical protein